MQKEYTNDLVDVITLNYNTKDILPGLFDSLRRVTYPNYKVTMVDNGSSDGSADFVEENYKEVNVIRSEKNLFFSRGNNLAISKTNGEFILLINSDIIVEPDFIELAVRKIKEDDKIAAVAVKMLLNDQRSILDSVGTVILDNGSPFNRGIGQPDIGQYDESVQTFGACFGCVLIRRQYYENEIGPLDNLFFGYFEDTDWCYRANLFGYKIVTEPRSVVYHAHSVTTRKNVPLWKQYLIYRNFIWTAQKNFRAWTAFKITFVRYRELAKQSWRYKQLDRFLVNVKIFFITILSFPLIMIKRFSIQRKRKVPDQEITKFSQGEAPFFEDINYKPLYTLENLEFSFKKVKEKSVDFNRIYKSIKKLSDQRESGGTDWIDRFETVLKNITPYLDPVELENFKNEIIKDYRETYEKRIQV